MIIDIHGHYTTAPKALEGWRNKQIAGVKNPSEKPSVSELNIFDDELRDSIETDQLKLMKERGLDRQLAREFHCVLYRRFRSVEHVGHDLQ